MSEEKIVNGSNADQDIQTGKESKRRVSYITRDLVSMIEFVAKVYNQLGHTDYHSNKAIAVVHGLSVDSIKQQLSSAQQYKLLEIKHGVGYKVTDHFQKIYLPRNESEKRTAVIESLKHPETYTQLFKDYEFHVVPSEGVKNHFIRSFGLKEDAAAKASQIFIDNLKDFELLDTRGVLISAIAIRPTIQEVKPEVDEEKNERQDNGNNSDQNNPQQDVPARFTEKMIFQSELERAGKKTVPIHLIDDKQAMFVYPDDITEEDIEIVKHNIDGILLKIKLEAKKRAREASEKAEGEMDV